MRTAVMLAALAASAFALAGCGGDDEPSDNATTTDPVETTRPPATQPTESTQATPQATVVTIRVVGSVPQGGIQRPTLELGEKVVLMIRTDSGEGIHLHGYDIERDVVPGQPVRIPFTASLPGRFELELHPTDTLLAVLEVRP